MSRPALILITSMLVGSACTATTTVTSIAPTPATPVTSAIPDNSTAIDAWENLRLEMVASQIQARGVDDQLVLDAMRSVPRHPFVPEEWQDQAYEDHPVPIGYGQTISQPYIVALMSIALDLEPGDKVLEIGTGSGYQAAVLAEMGMEVYSIEIIPELAARATSTLNDAGYSQVKVKQADGYWGWEEHAPFNAIVVTAAPDHLPQPLLAQLEEGGRLVIPIGPIGAVQTLWRFTRGAEEETLAENLGAVRFVPFTRDETG